MLLWFLALTLGYLMLNRSNNKYSQGIARNIFHYDAGKGFCSDYLSKKDAHFSV